jgi:integrase
MSLRIHKRGKIWHYRGSVAGRRLRGTTGATDKKIAQRIAAETENREWKRHLDGPEAHVTFAQAAIAYRGAEKSDRFLDRIEDYWKDTPVREITSGAIKHSAMQLYPNVKGATRNRQVIGPTQAIINFAAELGWCSRITAKKFPVESKTKEPASADWVTSFAAHASPHLGALCFFMFGTGSRIGEAVALTWADVDLGNRTAIIRQTKTRSERTTHLPPPVLASLANIPSNRNPNNRVFKYAWRDSTRQVWDNAIRRAGIKRLTPHSCRHGFATTMLRAGVDPKTVAKLGGWKDVGTVMRFYAHAMEDKTITDALFDTNLAQGQTRETATNYQKRIIKL